MNTSTVNTSQLEEICLYAVPRYHDTPKQYCETFTLKVVLQISFKKKAFLFCQTISVFSQPYSQATNKYTISSMQSFT